MFPLVKVKTPTGIDFFKEHKSIIDSNVYVGFVDSEKQYEI